MARYTVRLATVVYDTKQPSHDRNTLTFFDRRTGESPSIAECPEDVLLNYVLSVRLPAQLVCGALGIKTESVYHTGVVQPFTTPREKPGDIDGLVLEPNAPQWAVALECKRVKVRTKPSGDQRINRLKGLESAFVQANALHDLGFAQSYLAVVAVVDARFDPMFGPPFSGLHPAEFQRVFDIVTEIPLADGVGIVYIELVQPFNAPMSSAGMCAVGLLRPAARREQSAHVTERVLNYMTAHGRRVGQW